MKFYYLFVAVLIFVIIFIASEYFPYPLQVKSFEQSNIFNVLGTVFVIAIFLERAQDVILTAFRYPESARLKAEIAKLEKNGNKTTDQEKLLSDYSDELGKRRLKTRKLALSLGLLLGIITSAVGIRLLSNLVVVHDIQNAQLFWFKSADILITGAMLAGGSEGIHQIIELLRDFKDNTSAKLTK